MKSIIKFLSEARTELLKVSWPARNVALNLTLAVVVISIGFAVYIGGVDYLLTQGIRWITIHSNKTAPTSSVNSQTIPVNGNSDSPINIGDIQTSQ